jgi:hypothetical protein
MHIGFGRRRGAGSQQQCEWQQSKKSRCTQDQ